MNIPKTMIDILNTPPETFCDNERCPLRASCRRNPDIEIYGNLNKENLNYTKFYPLWSFVENKPDYCDGYLKLMEATFFT